MSHSHVSSLFFFFNDTATTEIYTLSLHDALPILAGGESGRSRPTAGEGRRDRTGSAAARSSRRTAPGPRRGSGEGRDRKSTRLNSSHGYISYAVFCLKKKKIKVKNGKLQI